MSDHKASGYLTERYWLKRYPAGVPPEIDSDRYPTLLDFFEKAVQRHADHIAYLNFGIELTFAELAKQSEAFATYLQHNLDLKPGERIALMMPNCLQYPVALFGALRAGLVVVNINPLYTSPELKHQLKDSGAKAIVLLTNFVHKLQKVVNDTALQHVIISQVGDALPRVRRYILNFVVRYIKKKIPAWQLPGTIDFMDCIKSGGEAKYHRPDVTAKDLAFLQYTGGTTGTAKGAMLTHRNILANIEQIKAMYGNILTEGQEVMVTALPLYHIFALTVNCLFFLEIGGCNLLITNPYDITGIAQLLKKTRFTIIAGVNTLFNGFLNNDAFNQLDFSRLKLSVAGGMAIQQKVAERWEKLTGNCILEGYGLTECSPLVSVNPYDISSHTGSIGLAVPSTEIKLINDQHLPVGLNTPGELCVRGPQVMVGYWQCPEATEAVIDADGWLQTGDIATLDEQGFIHIVDRKKDMILVSGFNVYPSDIETVLLAHPKVSEAVAIAVPSETTGEAVKVFIVAKDRSLTTEELIGHCRGSLAGYKVPKLYEFRDSLPKSNVGKVLRRELKHVS